MRTAGVWRGILKFLTSSLNEHLAREAADSGLRAEPVRVFSLGWQDPFRLPEYNALLIIPDRLMPMRDEILVKAPIAFVAAIRSSSPEALADAMAVYADAFANVFEEDPRAAGAAHEVLVNDMDFSLPAPGAPLVGALTVLATVSIDQIF
jgi:hypothetical protein